MKKSMGIYGVIWVICLAIFNVVAFVMPEEIAGMSRFGDSFWVGYVFITVAFVGQLVCSLIALSAKNVKKLFYHLPLISISYGGLVAMLIVGGVFMTLPMLPTWIGIIACVLILGLHAISVLKATAAAELVGGMDERVKNQTSFMKNLTAEAQALIGTVRSDALRAEAQRVYEAIRYGNPTSGVALAELDARLERQFNAFKDAVESEDLALSKSTARGLLEMVEARNLKAKRTR